MPNIRVTQRDKTDCGAACLTSILAFYKLKVSVFKIRQLASGNKGGISVLGLIQAAGKLNLQAKGVKCEKDSLLSIPLPAIAHIKLNSNLNHFVVIYKTSNSNVTIMDPSDGEVRKMSADDFKKIWTGVMVLFKPNSAFNPANRTASVWRRLFTLILPHRAILTFSIVGAIIATILGLFSAIYMRFLFDVAIPEKNLGLLFKLSLGMLLVVIAQTSIALLRRYYMLKVTQKIDKHLILGYYEHIMHLPQEFFDSMRIGEITARIGDAVKIRTFINNVSVSLVVDFLTVIFSLVLMIFLSWKMTILVVSIVPVYTLIFLLMNAYNKKFLKHMMIAGAELESQLVETLFSIRTIKIFGLELEASNKTEAKLLVLLRENFKGYTVSLFGNQSLGFSSQIFSIVLLGIGASFVIADKTTPGVLISFYSLLAHFTIPFKNLLSSNTSIQNALIAAERLFELMDIERENLEGSILINSEAIHSIRIQNLTFRYGPNAPVLKNVNAFIDRGKITAIVGESGSGKSTLAALLQKLYSIEEGNIFYGDHRLSIISRNSLKKVLCVVPQNIDILKGSVLENIILGDDVPDIERVERICKQLDIIDFIEKLPGGFSCNIGESGIRLSGGQVQRIGIARAIYRNPTILILDEATSHLDNISESVIFRAVQSMKRDGKTIIVIAHRLSTIRNADTVILMKSGRVTEQGTFQNLLSAKGDFFEMWNEQYNHS